MRILALIETVLLVLSMASTASGALPVAKIVTTSVRGAEQHGTCVFVGLFDKTDERVVALTCNHVVHSPEPTGTYDEHGKDIRKETRTVKEVIVIGEQEYGATVLQTDAKRDLALLVTDVPKSEVSLMFPATSDPPDQATVTFHTFFPAHRTYQRTLYHNMPNSVNKFNDMYTTRELFEHGESGGAVVYDGRLVGLVSGYSNSPRINPPVGLMTDRESIYDFCRNMGRNKGTPIQQVKRPIAQKIAGLEPLTIYLSNDQWSCAYCDLLRADLPELKARLGHKYEICVVYLSPLQARRVGGVPKICTPTQCLLGYSTLERLCKALGCAAPEPPPEPVPHPEPLPEPQPEPQPEPGDSVMQRIDSLSRKVATLEASVNSLSDSSLSIAVSVDALNEQVIELKSRPLTRGPQGPQGEQGIPGESPAVSEVAAYLLEHHRDALQGIPGESPDVSELAAYLVENHRDALRGARGLPGEPGPETDAGSSAPDPRIDDLIARVEALEKPVTVNFVDGNGVPYQSSAVSPGGVLNIPPVSMSIRDGEEVFTQSRALGSGPIKIAVTGLLDASEEP